MVRKFFKWGIPAHGAIPIIKVEKYESSVSSDKKGLSGTHGCEQLLHQTEDSVKTAAKILKKWDEAKAHPEYVAQK